jgi:hypothetical protein
MVKGEMFNGQWILNHGGTEGTERRENLKMRQFENLEVKDLEVRDRI